MSAVNTSSIVVESAPKLVADPKTVVDVKQAAVVDPALASVVIRRSKDRGHANHGWLNSYHTFSFAGYNDSRFGNFHSLRVINEDRVMESEGFGTHPHSNYEIFSYVVGGSLSHRDSMGNAEMLRRGDIQFTSAGSGIMHSEFNGSNRSGDYVHFLQIWVKPNRFNTKPKYQTKHFSDVDKMGRLALIVAPETEETIKAEEAEFAVIKSLKSNGKVTAAAGGAAATKDTVTETQPVSSIHGGSTSGPATVKADMRVYASILGVGQTITHTIEPNRECYVHVIQDVTGLETEANQTGLNVNGVKLSSGDGAFITKTGDSKPNTLQLTGASTGTAKTVEFLLLDIARTN